jgi:SSS family solute:Na+ symporter
MILYAEIGGFKAIVYSDAIQGTLLLVVLWLICITCITKLGGLGNMMGQVKDINPQLLSSPGPHGLFTWQFLLTSMIAVVMIPVSQPQLTTRLVVMRDLKSMKTMAFAVGTFAIVVILATVFIGMYGAVKYGNVSAQEFWAKALLYDQFAPVAALAVVGLFAACLSTTNAQIFALGNELRSLLPGDEKIVMRKTKISLFVFACLVMVFASVMGDELALLARVSFTGTSMMAPIVLAAIIKKNKPGKEIILISVIALLLFLGSLAGFIPSMFSGFRIELLLYVCLVLGTVISLYIRKNNSD